MILDIDLLNRFEEGLDTLNVSRSAVKARILGYGEISCIFCIDGADGVAYKRMPLFADRASAEKYEANYHQYCGLLEKAGIRLPETATAVIAVSGRPVSLYIAQSRLDPKDFCNAIIGDSDRKTALGVVEGVAKALNLVREFNAANAPGFELGVDGQISNWALPGRDMGRPPLFLDTSTPLFRVNGAETMDPELLLKATPVFLRFIVRRFFLEEVMTRYYDPRRIFTDIAANLYKEHLPHLVGDVLGVLNDRLPSGSPPISVSEVEGYYREDKLIWQSFLALRRLDRFFQTRLKSGPYPFILPGKIKR